MIITALTVFERMRPNQINIHKNVRVNQMIDCGTIMYFYHSLYPLSLKEIWNGVMRRGIRRTHHITRLSIRNTEKGVGRGNKILGLERIMYIHVVLEDKPQLNVLLLYF